jgi:hypothetical protein
VELKNVFEVAIEGKLTEFMKKEKAHVERSVTSSVKKASKYFQNDLRRQTKKAGLGSGVEKAWRRTLYPSRGRSMKQASLVFSKSKRIHEAFEKGGTVRANKAKWLVIPLDAAVKRAFDKSMEKSKSSQPRRYANTNAAHYALERLTFVQYEHDKALLVEKKNGKSIAYFLLVKEVKLRKMFDVKGSADKWGKKMFEYMTKALNRR